VRKSTAIVDATRNVYRVTPPFQKIYARCIKGDNIKPSILLFCSLHILEIKISGSITFM